MDTKIKKYLTKSGFFDVDKAEQIGITDLKSHLVRVLGDPDAPRFKNSVNFNEDNIDFFPNRVILYTGDIEVSFLSGSGSIYNSPVLMAGTFDDKYRILKMHALDATVVSNNADLSQSYTLSLRLQATDERLLIEGREQAGILFSVYEGIKQTGKDLEIVVRGDDKLYSIPYKLV